MHFPWRFKKEKKSMTFPHCLLNFPWFPWFPWLSGHPAPARSAHNIQKQPTELFCKKGVLRNFAKFTGKHLCQRLFFNKVAGLSTFGRLLLNIVIQSCSPCNKHSLLKRLIKNVFRRNYLVSLHKKWSFPLRISWVNVTKSAVSWGSGQIYWRNP